MPTVTPAGGNVFRKFTTRAFATGVPTTLAGSPVISIYKDDSLTQSTAGVTLDVDFDGVAGLNHVTIDTSADGTFYANGSTFYLVITTGTVGGTSVVGEVIGDFELAAAAPSVADIASGVWKDTASGDFTVSGSIGKSLFTSGNAPGAADGLMITTNLPANFGGMAIDSAGGVTLADGVAHGGTPGSSTATLAFNSVNITAAAGRAFTVKTVASDAAALYIYGGSGVQITSSTSGNDCLSLTSNGTGACINLGPNGPGGRAVNAYGGIAVYAYAGDDDAVSLLGVGTGKKGLRIAGDSATDAMAIAAGAGTPIDVFDVEARVLVRFTGF